ncbi:MAG TPA: TonB-dependent receptor [Bryobacteraceae bacterium]|nr:TonB-dependent receptor [Bryobacteraceae bacterium]
MHSRRILLNLFFIVVFAGIAPFEARLRAQAISGDLVGRVTDASGAIIPNVSVTATNTATDVKASASTNAGGEYRISNLLPGNYDVSAGAPGFSTFKLKGVPVQLNQAATVDITLTVGSVSTSVEVSEAASVIDTTTAQIQTTYAVKQIADLPTNTIGVGVINMSLLQAGVASAGGIGVGAGPSIGGQRPRNNNFTVEGVDNNRKDITGPNTFVPSESVAEFTLLQNQFQAEFGHSSGGQFNTIVKSGSNQFHGELYEYLENRDLNAEDQTFKTQGIFTNPRFDRSHLGGNFGGPIIKNKLFFFSSFEYNPLGQSANAGAPVYAPTSAGYAALASAPGVSHTNLGVLQQYAVAPAVSTGAPNVTVGGISVPTGIIPLAAPNFTNSYFGVQSIDYNISDKDQVRGRFIYNRIDSINTVADLPAFYTTVPERSDTLTVAEYHTFSPTLTNEFRLGYERFNQSQPVGNQTFPGLDQFPNLSFVNLNLQVGPNPNFPQTTVNNVYSGTENLTWVHGNHTLKFGTEFRDYISPQFFTQRSRGDYEYTDVALFLQDITPDFIAQRNIGGRTYYGNQLATYSYAQDTWRIRPNLTLNLGVRYEYTTVPVGEQAQSLNAAASVPGLLNFKSPSADPFGIAPRVGFAYTPTKDGLTVIRGGFSMAYDVFFDNVGVLSVPPQFSNTVDLTHANENPGFLANGGISPAFGLAGNTPAQLRAATSTYIPDQKLPYSINYNLTVEHVFAKDYTLDVGYIGTKGVHLITQEQLDRQSPVTATQNIPTFLSAPSAATLAGLPLTLGQLRAIGDQVPAYANAGFTAPITSFTPQGYSDYNALTVNLKKRLAKGLQYQAAYTWSHLIDNSTAEVASTFLTPRRAEDFFNLSAEKGSSALDRRQRFTLSLLYDAPWYKNSNNWMLKNLAGNWEVAPIYTYESPELFTPQSGVDSNLNGDSAPDRTIINPAGAAGTASTVVGLSSNGTALPNGNPNIVAYLAQNPNARYVQAGLGAFANAGRNTQASRPIDNIDFSLIKHFAVRERYKIELAGQAFNLFNHPQFLPGGSINNANTVNNFLGNVQAYVTVSNPLFNNPTNTFSSNPRVLQITAKFFW